MIRQVFFRACACCLVLIVGIGFLDSAEAREINKWKIYEVPNYRFSFKVPPKSSSKERMDTQYQYIRVQNYSPDADFEGLGADQFYLEIFIYDFQKGHPSPCKCDKSLPKGRKIRLGNLTGRRGSVEAEGDVGADIRHVVCIEKVELCIYIQGTEGNSKGITVNRILDSLSFAK